MEEQINGEEQYNAICKDLKESLANLETATGKYFEVSHFYDSDLTCETIARNLLKIVARLGYEGVLKEGGIDEPVFNLHEYNLYQLAD